MKLLRLFEIDDEYGHDCYHGLFKTVDAMIDAIEKDLNKRNIINYSVIVDENKKKIHITNVRPWYDSYLYEIIETDELQ